ncbi:unnamed protein product [Cuscuta campestris]|uniref:Uncharacterized protein n=1 Tax=Cuscuta campestris TaxID=132261 RepID=A0A484NSE9_9ASTE|nr:unnamed protein product [Cuscuta campestris]
MLFSALVQQMYCSKDANKACSCCITLFHVGGNEFGLLWVDACNVGKGRDGYMCCRFTFDYKRALAGLKCCSLLWYSRCIAPRMPTRPVLVVDVPDHSTKGGHYHEGHYVSTPKQVLERRDGAGTSERGARSKQLLGKQERAELEP